jgi:hypothetical protein
MSRGEKRQVIPGVALILVGLLFLLDNFNIVNPDWNNIWIGILILLGISFWLGFLTDKKKIGLIMPGTVLLTIGIIFYVEAYSGWADMGNLWPFFILAPAFGFYAMFLLGKRDRELLVPAVILTIVGTIFLMTTIPGLIFVIAALLISIGILIILSSGKKKKDKDEL